ncbi:unnamed protein product [Leuciscus chuanchicus]
MGAAPSKDIEPIEEKGNTFCESEVRRRRGSLQNNPHNVRNDKDDTEEKTQKVYIELHKFVLILMVIVAALIVISDYLDNLKIKTRSVCLHQRSFLNPSSLP